MPFKDRIKQLIYLRKYAKEERKLLKEFKTKQKLIHNLTQIMILHARNFLQERRKYPIEPMHNHRCGLTLEKAFMLDSEDALKAATEAVCNEEDAYIRRTKDVRKIGIVQDLQVLLLNDKVGLIRESIIPLNDYDLQNLSSLM